MNCEIYEFLKAGHIQPALNLYHSKKENLFSFSHIYTAQELSKKLAEFGNTFGTNIFEKLRNIENKDMRMVLKSATEICECLKASRNKGSEHIIEKKIKSINFREDYSEKLFDYEENDRKQNKIALSNQSKANFGITTNIRKRKTQNHNVALNNPPIIIRNPNEMEIEVNPIRNERNIQIESVSIPPLRIIEQEIIRSNDINQIDEHNDDTKNFIHRLKKLKTNLLKPFIKDSLFNLDEYIIKEFSGIRMNPQCNTLISVFSLLFQNKIKKNLVYSKEGDLSKNPTWKLETFENGVSICFSRDSNKEMATLKALLLLCDEKVCLHLKDLIKPSLLLELEGQAIKENYEISEEHSTSLIKNLENVKGKEVEIREKIEKLVSKVDPRLPISPSFGKYMNNRKKALEVLSEIIKIYQKVFQVSLVIKGQTKGKSKILFQEIEVTNFQFLFDGTDKETGYLEFLPRLINKLFPNCITFGDLFKDLANHKENFDEVFIFENSTSYIPKISKQKDSDFDSQLLYSSKKKKLSDPIMID